MNRNKEKGIVYYASMHKAKVILSIILSLVSVATGIIPYIIVGKVLSIMIGGSATINDIQKYAFIGTLGFCFQVVFYNLSTAISHRLAFNITTDIRNDIINKMAIMSMGDLQLRDSGQYKQFLLEDIDQLEYPFAHVIPEISSNLVGFLALLIYLFVIDWRIALVALIPIIIGFIISVMMMKGGAMGVFHEYNNGKVLLNSATIEYVNGMEVIKAFNQTLTSVQKFSNAVFHFKDVMIKWFGHCWPYLSAYNVIVPASIAFVLPVGAFMLKNGSINIETFLFAMIVSLGIAPPLMKLIEFTDNIPTIAFGDKKLKKFFETDSLSNKEKRVAIDNDKITFSKVKFGYKDREILHDVSFEINPCSMTAFVGLSGAGKSTIAKLIARFWDVQEGSIYLDKHDIRDIPYEELMEHISYVSQDNFLFDMTIKENIRVGNANATDEQIIEVAKKAGCHEFITKLSEGYDTRVGDDGGILSGGERQRITIARAMLKNSPIIILDEATSYTDPENEALIQKSINNLTKDKTLIVVAHRLSTIVNAEKIIVLDQGRIKSEGTHKELLESSPLYKKLWHIQTGARKWGMKGEEVCSEQ
ncbi:MAG: ABC transporter ATP-binding protein [Clostridium botulinum]|nr:ABC transporter ATP-binding protein [Clostridium botulinum]